MTKGAPGKVHKHDGIRREIIRHGNEKFSHLLQDRRKSGISAPEQAVILFANKNKQSTVMKRKNEEARHARTRGCNLNRRVVSNTCTCERRDFSLRRNWK